jgi:hypothetical protein
MSIGTPTTLGVQGGSSNSIAITTTALVPAGNLVFVAIGTSGAVTAPNVSSVSDGTNTYNFNNNRPNNTSNPTSRVGTYWWRYTSPLSSSSTITVSCVAGGLGYIAAAAQVSGLLTSPNDSSGGSTNAASNTTFSVSSSALSVANEIVFGSAVWPGAASITLGSISANMTALYANQNGNSAINITLAYDIVNSNSAIAFSGTLSSIRNWSGAMDPFIGTPATAGAFNMPMSGL